MKASALARWQDARRKTLQPDRAVSVRVTVDAKAEAYIQERGGRAFVDLRCLDR